MEIAYQAFEENFLDCCGASCFRLALERRRTEADYTERKQECDRLYKLIEEKLGVDYKLINIFDAAKNHMLGFDDVFIYQQGFQDCVYLLHWIGVL